MEFDPDFARRLRDEFGGRYRMRWSVKRNEWHLEQQVGVGAADPPFRVDEGDDSLIRAKEGFAFVMAIRTGTRMPCPTEFGPKWDRQECGFEMKVPIMETREAVCEKCRAEGRDGRHAVAYYPLSDALIQHIRHIDFALGHNEDLKKMMDDRNQLLMDTKRKDTLNDIDAISSEVRKTFGAIEQIGYGPSIIRPVGNTSY
jgi:hypothetical protein